MSDEAGAWLESSARPEKFSSGIRGVRPVLNPQRAGKVDITRSYTTVSTADTSATPFEAPTPFEARILPIRPSACALRKTESLQRFKGGLKPGKEETVELGILCQQKTEQRKYEEKCAENRRN